MNGDRLRRSRDGVADRDGVLSVLHGNGLFDGDFVGLVAVGRHDVHAELLEVLEAAQGVAAVLLTREVKAASAAGNFLLYLGEDVDSFHGRAERRDQIACVNPRGIACDGAGGKAAQSVGENPFLLITLLERAPVASAECVFCVHD